MDRPSFRVTVLIEREKLPNQWEAHPIDSRCCALAALLLFTLRGHESAQRPAQAKCRARLHMLRLLA